MPHRLRQLCSVLPLCFGLWATAIHAQAAPEAAAQPQDAEEQLDNGLKGFGYLAGLALNCVAKEQRTTLEREAMDLNAEIARLMGIDRSFIFVAGFGYGTNVDVKADECKNVLTRYDSRVEKFRKGRGSKP